MIEVPIPQDILKYKTKFIANLSVRECVCGVAGAVVAIYCYRNFFTGFSNSMRICLGALPATPIFIVGFGNLFGQPVEKVIGQMLWDNFVCPPTRKNEVHRPLLEKATATTTANEPTAKKGKTKKKAPARAAKSKEYKGIR